MAARAAALLAALQAAQARTLVVDRLRGHDANDGSPARPLRTIGRAACHAVGQEARRRGGLAQRGGAAPAEEWTIELRGGAYPSLTDEDVSCFGTGVPLTVAPHLGAAVLMTGGKQIPSSAFKPAASGKGHLSVSLPSVGLPLGSYGVLVRALRIHPTPLTPTHSHAA